MAYFSRTDGGALFLTHDEWNVQIEQSILDLIRSGRNTAVSASSEKMIYQINGVENGVTSTKDVNFFGSFSFQDDGSLSPQSIITGWHNTPGDTLTGFSMTFQDWAETMLRSEWELLQRVLGGDDTIVGGSWDRSGDILRGFGGNDRLEGTEFRDVAAFSGSYQDAEITRNQDGTTTVSSVDGVDTLVNIERLSFDDKTLAYDVAGTPGAAYRIYKAAFDREPDADGLGYWIGEMDKGFSLEAVAQSFIDSAEFAQRYGQDVSDDAFLTQLYQNILGRVADQSGFAYWQNELAGGMSRAGVLASFSESSENTANIASTIENGIWFA